MTLTFPTLAGQGWSVHKAPNFSTEVAPHTSGREVRKANWVNPRWDFELTYEALDSTASGAYGGVGAQSLQTLMGFFLQTQGSYLPFVFYDPSDYAVGSQNFGTGDGTTTVFQLGRSLGGFSEPVSQPFAPVGTPALFPLQGTPTDYAPNNLLTYSGDTSNAAWTKTTMSVTTGIADPFGGTAAQTLTASGTASLCYQRLAATGANYVASMWMRRRTGTGNTFLRFPNNSVNAVTLTSSWRRFSASGAPGSGFAYCVAALTTSGDAIDVYGPQLEQSIYAPPAPYFQTLATPYYGGPWITSANALVDPSAYAISNGAVTFASAPASGAALAWTGNFGFLTRFSEDNIDFEQFMSNLWMTKSVKLKSVRPF